MRKKTTNHGREPTPFPGDEAQLRAALNTALAYYHVKPQTGHLAGASPNDCFARFVADGWTATLLDPQELAVAFSHQEVKPVRAGGRFRLNGTDYRADALQALAGRKVLVRRPMFGDRETLFVFTEFGEFVSIATPETTYAFGAEAGAGEQGRRAAALNRQVRALEAEARPAVAGGEKAIAEVVELYGAPVRALPPETVVRLDPEYSAAARMAKNAPARLSDEADRKQARREEEFAFLNRLAASGR
jgi:hypothetical protein